MSRPYQVRVWKPLEKEMVFDDEARAMEVANQSEEELATSIVARGVMIDDPLVESTDPILNRWSGLADAEGTDIYEGDLLQVQTKDGAALWQVLWFSDSTNSDVKAQFVAPLGFAARCISHPDAGQIGTVKGIAPQFDAPDLGVETTSCLIVGNIHENPELLS